MTDTTPAGATPVVAGATPTQTSPASDAGSSPATGATDPDAAALGDPGKRALDAMKSERTAALARATAAEKELETLRAASQTDHEKALAEAKRSGADEVLAKAQRITRRAEVRRALQAAGCSDVEIAAMAHEFAALSVDDEGSVDGLDRTIAAFRTAHPTLFAVKAAGSFDTGTAGGQQGAGRSFTRQELRDVKFYTDNKAEIDRAFREGRITG